MKPSTKTLITAAVIVAAFAFPAFAADSGNTEWVEPLTKGIDKMTYTLVTIAGGIIGLCVVGFGIGASIRGGHIQFEKLWGHIVGAVIVTIGPAAILWLIDTMKGAS